MSEWSANRADEAARVWAIFSGMYGARLTRDFGESVPDVWRQSISSLPRHEIERGLRRLAVGGSGSPPTLPQFIKACKMVGDDEGTIRPRSTVDDHKRLEAPPANPFIGKGHVILLRWMLKANPPDHAIKECRAIVDELAKTYFEISKEDEVTDNEYMSQLHKRFAAVN